MTHGGRSRIAAAMLVAGASAWACSSSDGGGAAPASTGGQAGAAAESGGAPQASAGGTAGSPSSSGGAAPGGGGTAGSQTGNGGAPGNVDAGPLIDPGDPGAADVRFTISAHATHPISPLVYGMAGDGDIGTVRQSLCRSGGNRLTAYNWENNASNAGSDYLFQNDDLMSQSNTPGAAISPMVKNAKDHGAASIVTVPIVDYVSADKNGGGDVRNSGADYLQTRFKKNLPKKGSAFTTTPDPNDDSVYEDEFVSWLKGAVPGARVLFALDNEPDLWSSTHAEVHPAAVRYDELVKRNTDFATAIKAVWPEAEVTGFVSYGWNGYVNLQNAPDAGGRDFIDFYLDQMKTAENAAGKRLIDYLDLHWYPEARDAAGTRRINDVSDQAAATTPEVVKARLDAPRSLWDPTYRETSWINDTTGGAIRLIPRLQEKIAAHYPGTKLAFTEWNYGAGWHVSGAIASADVLGIFGREGVGAASFWGLSKDESFTMAAFEAYRNYDGQGGAFGDTGLSATTTDAAGTSVYASMDAATPAHVVVVALNKRGTVTKAGIQLTHATRFTAADVYTITQGGGAKLVKGAAIAAVATNAFVYSMPAQSVSVIVPRP